METLVELTFLITFITTLVITRISVHKLHDRDNYGTSKDKSKTITGILRRKTKYDWHHYHLGFILLVMSLLLYLFEIKTITNLIIFTIGLSWVCDQLIPMILLGRRYDYFDTKQTILSATIHLVVAGIALYIW